MVEVSVEQLFGRVVVQNLPRQTVDAIGKKADLVSGAIGNTFSLGDEPPQHTVVAFVCTFLTGRIRMGEEATPERSFLGGHVIHFVSTNSSSNL